jgi:Aspartyl protease
MSISHRFAASVLAITIATSLLAESRCPGNVVSLPFHLVNHHQIVVSVSVNHSGPYNFLLDTGTQFTMVDSSLAAKLHLTPKGKAAVAGYGINELASLASLDLIEVGPHGIENLEVILFNLRKLQSSDLDVQGILGEDFLQHFDMLIDNAHNQLCLDNSDAMRANVKGERIALVTPDQKKQGRDLPNSLVVAAHFANGMRIVHLKLDSGANAGFLYQPSNYLALGSVRLASTRGAGVDGQARSYSVLPLQNLKIGRLELTKAAFYAVAGVEKDPSTTEFDGLLPMGLFRRVFIDHAEHLAVLDPW